jgi:uncharacterized protein YjbJ (UPF0337 family)
VSTSDRFDDRVDRVSGKTKEWTGKATDDERLEAEGRTQHDVAETKENVRDATDKVKDAFADTAHKVREAFRR